MPKILYFVFLFSILSKYVESAKILGMFSSPVISHQTVFKTLSQELAKRGHDVTVITSMSVAMDKKTVNYREFEFLDIGMSIRNELLVNNTIHNQPDIFGQFDKTLYVSFKVVDALLDTKEVRDLIKHETFDLILIEDCTRSALILSHLLKTPVITISSFGGSFGTFDIVGGMIHPILYPLATKERFQSQSMWEKISDIYNYYRLHKLYEKYEERQDNINKRIYGPNTPTLNELRNNVQMVFLNVNPIWDSNRPVPPNVVYLGGLHKKPNKELPKELKFALDSSKNGVIYMSFGTSVGTGKFSKRILRIFIDVFSKLPYDVFWKWDDGEIPNLPENIKMAKWFPQSDVLQHPNVKLFITQGGLQSTDEAIDAGVPLIGIPILWDQWFNTYKYVQLKIGIQLFIDTLNEDKLLNAIDIVIGRTEYRENIINLRSIILDSPQSSLDRAVWWTEYVLRHSAKHLRAPSANMTWKEYYQIEIILNLLFIVIVLVSLIFSVLKCLLKFVFVTSSKKVKTK